MSPYAQVNHGDIVFVYDNELVPSHLSSCYVFLEVGGRRMCVCCQKNFVVFKRKMTTWMN